MSTGTKTQGTNSIQTAGGITELLPLLPNESFRKYFLRSELSHESYPVFLEKVKIQAKSEK